MTASIETDGSAGDGGVDPDLSRYAGGVTEHPKGAKKNPHFRIGNRVQPKKDHFRRETH